MSFRKAKLEEIINFLNFYILRMFKHAINKTDFEELVATASDEFIVDKKGNKKLKARRLTGT
jgi:hypothetical protein